MTEIMW